MHPRFTQLPLASRSHHALASTQSHHGPRIALGASAAMRNLTDAPQCRRCGDAGSAVVLGDARDGRVCGCAS